AVNGYFLYLFLRLAEHLLALHDAYRVVEVDYRRRSALASLEGLAYNMLAALSQHLNRNVRRDHAVVDKGAQKLVLSLARRGEADFYLLEAHLKKQLVKLKLFLKIHGYYKA